MNRLITVLILVFGCSRGEYSDSLGREIIYPLAVDAYNHGVENCIQNTLGDHDFGGQFTVQCDSKKDTCSAYVVAHPGSKIVAIVFRGSTSEGEVEQEANETLNQPMVPFVGGGKVNLFFNNGFNLLWNAGLKNSFLSLKNKYPDYQVVVTGHSLGAAEATICAGTLAALKYVNSSKLLLMTFGSPRTGDKEFADAYKNLVPEAYRVVHKNDLIPHLPPEGLLGYIHIASEIWYNNNMKCDDPYVICDEEESFKCSNQVLTPTMEDHGEYYGLRNYLGNHECVPPGKPCS